MYREAGWSPALRPGRPGLCIVVVCEDDEGETRQVGQELLKLNSGVLRAYEGIWLLKEHPPQEPVAAVILATHDDPETVGQTLQWTRHRWPRCFITVVSDMGGEGHEMAARVNGANFLTRPVTPDEWRAIVGHATGCERYLEGGSSPERAGPLIRGLMSGRPEISMEPAAVRLRRGPPENVRIV